MRCRACNVVLTDFEATRKYKTGDYVELCNSDFNWIKADVEVIERKDLKDESYEEDDE